ncbi:MAG: hypothetical protein JNM72_07950 [Deltaproteobacteria bacterium]|nr:hypothetical protein [Deltaproteobacteria bacterium]
MSDERRSAHPPAKAGLSSRLRDLAARLDAWLDALDGGRPAPALVPVPVRVRSSRARRR